MKSGANGKSRFKDCADTHFASETRFAQALNFHFEQHELAHQHLQKELQYTLDQLVAKAGSWSEYVMDFYPQFLRGWLIEHITSEDMKMKPVLQSHPYDWVHSKVVDLQPKHLPTCGGGVGERG